MSSSAPPSSSRPPSALGNTLADYELKKSAATFTMILVLILVCIFVILTHSNVEKGKLCAMTLAACVMIYIGVNLLTDSAMYLNTNPETGNQFSHAKTIGILNVIIGGIFVASYLFVLVNICCENKLGNMALSSGFSFSSIAAFGRRKRRRS